MKYRVACGMLEFFIYVEASSEEEAVLKGRQEALERIADADFWATPASPRTGEGKGASDGT